MPRKTVLLILLIIIIAFAAYMELGFRATLYQYFGSESIFAGSLPNFVAVVLLTMVYINLRDGRKGASSFKFTALAVMAMVAYELAQPLIPGRVFDVKDILASLIGGLFVYGILAIVDYYFKSNLAKKSP